tara:strand:- start:7119 stop:7835 length:717 start_codon:yes stop_codon:yes gene_type:complete
VKRIGFIPARSGSKRFPNKNISVLGDKPLVCWTIDEFILSDCFDKIIFSSDSEEYFELVTRNIKSNDLEFDNRSSKEAGDKIKIFDYISDNINKWAKSSDIFTIGLPTCPFRNKNHIKDCFDLFNKFNKSVFSACEYDFHVPFSFSLDPQTLEWDSLFDESPLITGNTRSQDQVKYYHPNGGVYIVKAEKLINKEIKTFYTNAIAYIMDRNSSIDIDTKEDLEYAKFYLEKFLSPDKN